MNFSISINKVNGILLMYAELLNKIYICGLQAPAKCPVMLVSDFHKFVKMHMQ